MIKWLLLLAICFNQVSSMANDIDPENIVGPALAGVWQTDGEINQRLGVKDAVIGDVVFERNDRLITELPQDEEAPYQAAGKVTFPTKNGERTASYALGQRSGNPVLVLFMADANKPDGLDREYAYVMLGRGSMATQDILFLGGDHARERFVALKRKSK